MATEYLFLFAVVLAINLMPAFGPPTWAIIVLFGLNTDIPLPGLVLTAATASSTGRFLLAHGFRLFSYRLSDKTRDNLAAARAAFERRRHHGLLALVFFAVSPLPSAQQFGAAGLAGVRILPFTAAFFAGRLVSYSFYGGSAKLLDQHTSLGDTFRESLTNPVGVVIQLVMLAALVALAKVDWVKIFGPAKDKDGE